MAEIKEIKYYLLVDLEATCAADNSIPHAEKEIIEIGAIMVRASDFAVEFEYQSFVRPVRNPVLTNFCKSLTHIEQADVDGARPFPVVMDEFWNKCFFRRYDVVWGSWGYYDRNQFRYDCQYHQIDYQLPEHMNFKNVFSAAQGRSKRYGMNKALNLCGLPWEGMQHRALTDTRNMYRMMPWIVGGRKIGDSKMHDSKMDDSKEVGEENGSETIV